MRNGYFQLVCGASGTGLKIFAPIDGGSPVNIKELMEYLVRYGIMYDTPSLNKAVQEAMTSPNGESQVLLNANPSMEVRENYMLHVSQDRMLATARFYPPSVNGERMTIQEFLNDLAHKNIKFGIQAKELTAFFQQPVYCKDILVAKGQPPRHGEDARIEYYFETDLRAKPTLNEDGSVDFFHLNTISHCKKGDILARLFPGDPGEYGRSIYDEMIKPRDIKRLSLKYGRNISISEDRQVLTTEVDGHVTLVDDKVFVSDVLEVENVDNSTGNIEYEGNVKINGNVCTNFKVKAKGDIEVKGVVEGAILEAEGNIIIARGMNGMAKGILKAGGNVIAKFIENSKVSAGGYVSTESILHSEVMAGTEIIVSGRKGFITGGRVCATNLIQVKTLGSPMGADTIVEVGADPGVKMRLQQLQKLVVENKKTIDSVHPVLSATAQKLSQGVKLKPDQIKYFQEMLQQEKQKKQEMEEALKEMEGLQQLLDESAAAKIEVTGEVFGGTRICIADVSMVVKNSMTYCKFVKSQGDVKMVSL